MSSRSAIRRFSGRVTPCIAAMMAVVRVRRSTLRSARPGGQRVRIRFVVEQDQDPIRVGEIPLVLLDPRAGERPAQFGRERRRQQLRQIEVRDFRHQRAEFVLRLSGSAADRPRARRCRLPPASRTAVTIRLRLRRPLSSMMTTGRGVEIGAEVGVHPRRVRDGDRRSVLNQSSGEGTVLDQELDIESAGEDPVEGPNDQLVLTDGQRVHRPPIIEDVARALV